MVCTNTFPPMVAAAGLAPGFTGFGPSTSDTSSNSSAPNLVQRVSVIPDPVRGAFRHVCLFKNILIAADGDASCTLRIFDVRDWSEKQKIRVGAVDAASTNPNSDDDSNSKLVPAAVSVLQFDGTTIACGTHEGYVHTWRLMAQGNKRGYVRLLQPLRVDSVPVTKVFLLGDGAEKGKLLAAHSSSKRAFVVWELDTGKLKGAFNTDGVAQGVPLRITEACGTVLACVHADGDDLFVKGNENNSTRNPVLAFLDVATGEGGALRDADVLIDQGTPCASAFDGEVFVVGTNHGTVVLWNLHTGAPAVTASHGFRKTLSAVGAIAIVPGKPNRVMTGGADRGVMLWNTELKPLARLELGSQVTCVHSPSPRVCVAGTTDGFVEVLSLCDPKEKEVDAELLEDRKKNSKESTSSRKSSALQYIWKHDSGSAASSYASFDSFTRRVPVWEGPYTPHETEKTDRASSRKNASGFSASRAMSGSAPTAADIAETQKKEEEEQRAKQRDMDGAGVARNPNVKPTLERITKCSNPTCVERSDTLSIDQKMLRCSRCKAATYCSMHCQRTHWRDGHKGKCMPPPMVKEVVKAEATAEVNADTVAPAETKPETPVETPTETPAPVRRALVVEDDSEDESSDDEEATVLETPAEEVDTSSLQKLVVIQDTDAASTCESNADTSIDAAQNEHQKDSDDSDDDAPALPPWMTSHRPLVSNGGTQNGTQDVPPAVRKRDAVETREEPTNGVELAGLQKLDDDDLLYELD